MTGEAGLRWSSMPGDRADGQLRKKARHSESCQQTRLQVPAAWYAEGENVLTHLASAFLEQLGSEALKSTMLHAGTPLKIVLGTFCSGTEIIKEISQAVQTACQKRGVPLEISHAFLCEKDTAKRKFGMHVCSNACCAFKDVADMNQSEAPCETHRGQCPVPELSN